MCGLAGVFGRIDFSSEELKGAAARMTQAIAHRGPDDAGIWVDAENGLALGFRRLAIVDLSSEGHQPMLSACGRYIIIFNGEVYNHGILRRELESVGCVLAS